MAEERGKVNTLELRYDSLYEGEMTFYCQTDYLLIRFGIPAFLVFSLPLFLLFALTESFSEPRAFRIFLFLLVTVLVVVLASILLYIRLFPVKVTSEGIVGHSANGMRRSLRWEELVCEGRLSNYGFPCYRLASRERRVSILLPVFLKDYERLQTVLASHGLVLNESVPSTPRAPRQRHNIVQRREGGYIVITTEKL